VQDLFEGLREFLVGDLEKNLAYRKRRSRHHDKLTSLRNGGSITAISTWPLRDSGNTSGSSRSYGTNCFGERTAKRWSYSSSFAFSSRFLCWNATKAVGQHINAIFVDGLHSEWTCSAMVAADSSEYLQEKGSVWPGFGGARCSPLIIEKYCVSGVLKTFRSSLDCRPFILPFHRKVRQFIPRVVFERKNKSIYSPELTELPVFTERELEFGNAHHWLLLVAISLQSKTGDVGCYSFSFEFSETAFLFCFLSKVVVEEGQCAGIKLRGRPGDIGEPG